MKITATGQIKTPASFPVEHSSKYQLPLELKDANVYKTLLQINTRDEPVACQWFLKKYKLLPRDIL